MQNKLFNQSYLKDDQYRSADHLNARIALHQDFSTSECSWEAWVFEHLGMRQGLKILAVGCGNATQWQKNQKRFPASTAFTLMDLSPGMLAEARAGLQLGPNRFCFVNADAQCLPFEKAQFDRVTANHMLYHVPDIDLAVAECARVIKPDGLFLAATNGANHMADFYALLSEFDSSFEISRPALRRFGLRNGRAYLEKAFRSVCVDTFDCDLWVTDARALVDYAFSMWDVQDTIAMDRWKAMLAFFSEKIKPHGGIKIRKETGLFLASHTPGLIELPGILQAEEQAF
jgi:ubiquinone/menaquinone biosynthesis C-methylase UbiE